jgi:hypothetical protein
MAYTGQDPKVISVFEIVSSYFVDCYFNHIWHSARVNLAGGTSLTDEYVRRIQAFITGAKNDPRCYSEVIKGVHSYFTGTTRFTALSFADFVDRIVGVCVPSEYFRQFSAQDKDELLSSVICDLVSNLAAGATKPDMLRRIIDNHTVAPEVTVRMLQDIAVGALIAKRASLHNKFLHKMGQARDSVPLDVVEDMKKALRRLVREKAEAVERAEEAEERMEEMRDDLRKAKQREAKLRELIALIRAGATSGAAAAGLDALAARSIPRRERTAEVRSQSESESESESESGSETASETESESDRGRRRSHKHSHKPSHKQRAQPAAAAVSADFFKPAPALSRPAATTGYGGSFSNTAAGQPRPPTEHPYTSQYASQHGSQHTSQHTPQHAPQYGGAFQTIASPLAPLDQISMSGIGASVVSQPSQRRGQGLDAILDEDYEY